MENITDILVYSIILAVITARGIPLYAGILRTLVTGAHYERPYVPGAAIMLAFGCILAIYCIAFSAPAGALMSVAGGFGVATGWQTRTGWRSVNSRVEVAI